jgi:hypothetical protein
VSENDAEDAVRIARSIIDGSISVLPGCRKILGSLRRLGVDREKPFVIFVGIDSESDHLPLDPEERKHWSPEALIREDKEIERYTKWAEKLALPACRAVIERFGKAG